MKKAKGYTKKELEKLTQNAEELDVGMTDEEIAEYMIDEEDIKLLTESAKEYVRKNKSSLKKMSQKDKWKKSSEFVYDFSEHSKRELIETMEAIARYRKNNRFSLRTSMKLPPRLDTVLGIFDDDYKNLSSLDKNEQTRTLMNLKFTFPEYVI